MNLTFFCTACEHNPYCQCGCGGGKSISVHTSLEARERHGWDQIAGRWVCDDCLFAGRQPRPTFCIHCGRQDKHDPSDYYHYCTPERNRRDLGD